MPDNNAKYLKLVRELSDRIVEAQRPIRILDAIKWNGAVRTEFFASGARNIPAVDADYYLRENPLEFDPATVRGTFGRTNCGGVACSLRCLCISA